MSEQNELHKVLAEYLHKIESLQESLPMIMIMTHAAKGATTQKKAKFLEEKCILVEESDETKKYKVPLELVKHANRLEKKQNRAFTAHRVLPSKFLISFVSEYDAFLGNLIKCLFKIKPEILNASEKNISFSDLLELGSIEAAHEQILEKEVETIMRKSHSEHLKWLEMIIGIPLTKGLDSWPTFIELTERRNLLVHCDGIVSSQYISVCKRNDVKLDAKIQPGIKLETSKSYLSESYKCLYEIGTKLTHVLWRKMLPDDLPASDNSLINISLELIQEKEYDLAKRILDFSTGTLKKWGSEQDRRILIINRAQAYYHSGDTEKCNKILDTEDWSACGDQFKICHHVLKEKLDDAIFLMKRIGKNGCVSETNYLEWPVLISLREHKDFAATYKEIFGREPTNISELTIDAQPFLKHEAIDINSELERLALDHVY
jgi:hypothetical protein